MPNRRLAVQLSRLWSRAWPVAAALLAAPVAAIASDSDWLPLRPGSRHVYQVHRDHSYAPEHESIDRTFHVGTATQTMRAADSIAKGAVAVEERVRIEPLMYGAKEERFETRILSFGDQLLLHGSGAIGQEGADPPVRYQPPLVLLPGATPGTTWSVGTVRDGETRVEMQGEVVGTGPLEGTPTCKSCLLVRYTGKITGKIPIYQGEAKILSGTFLRRIWMERGVGIVREDTEAETEIELPDGKRAKTAQKQTLRLTEHKPAP